MPRHSLPAARPFQPLVHPVPLGFGLQARWESACQGRTVASSAPSWRLPRGHLSLRLGGCYHIPHCTYLKIALKTWAVEPFAARAGFLWPGSSFPGSQQVSWWELSEPQEQKLHFLMEKQAGHWGAEATLFNGPVCQRHNTGKVRRNPFP